MRKPSTQILLSDKTATGAGDTFEPWGEAGTYHGYGTTSSGSGASVITVQVSNDNVSWINMGTITLTLGTTVTADGFCKVVPWKYVRGYVTSISGTGAKVSLIMGNLA
jgi:hypothetical protein